MSSLTKNRCYYHNRIFKIWKFSTIWPPSIILMIIILYATVFTIINCQCPWPRTPIHVSLHSDCVCGYSNVRRLSVQCSPMANFSQLLEVLNSPSVQRLPIDLLYINNATGLSILPKNAFKKLDIQQLHLANTFLEKIDKDAFAGLENKLNSLTLQNTGLKEIPATIKTLKSLKTLDLSNNRIRRIRPQAFEDLNQLSTLRLAFNHDIHLDINSFNGLGRTLKNLNLKGINLKHIPDAILNLTELAFLDLAQNKIEEIKPRMFRNHHLLTALSLERNLIRSMHPDTFVGLNDSLSSLSLLNNMLIEFPLLALSKLTGLRVLDLGFNAIRQLPEQSFRSNELLTLLALDGNPLKTLSLQTFKHLNNSLRGLSIGGKFFECDCKIRWLAEWSREYSLQITSRERNPQFCSRPPHLRNKLFTNIDLDDFVCPPLVSINNPILSPITLIPMTTTTTTTIKMNPTSPTPKPSTATTMISTTTTTTKKMTTPLTTTTSKSTQTENSSSLANVVTSYVHVVPMINEEKIDQFSPTTRATTLNNNNVSQWNNKSWQLPTSTIRSSSSNLNHNHHHHHQHQSIGPATLKLTDVTYRNGSIHLRWETLRPSQLGYQILYRYFGSKEFYRSELLIPLTNSYTIDKYIAPNELIIVCVVNLDLNDPEINNYDEEGENIIPNGQCKELNTREPIVKKTMPTTRNGLASGTPSTTTLSSSFYPTLKRLNDIDKIVIGISAAVCLFIIIAVLIFSCCFYRSSSKDSPLRTLSTNATCLSTKSLSPLAKSTFDHEWETVSVYSTRSIPRARITHTIPIGPQPTDTLRSSSHHHNGYTHPVSRYIGSTLPPPPPQPLTLQKSTNFNSPWLESYLHHYPSVNHLHAISYGTLVTANGGGGGGGASIPYVTHNGQYSMDTFNNGHLIERNKSNYHHHNHQKQHQQQSSSSKLEKNRQQQQRQQYSKSHIDLRSNADSNGSSNGGCSSNRMLLSSTSTASNSYQSQNDYDSDHHHHPNHHSNHQYWNNSHQQQSHRTMTPALKNNSSSISPITTSSLSSTGPTTSASAAATTSTTSANQSNNPNHHSTMMMMMNNDNEVDIYIVLRIARSTIIVYYINVN